MISTRILAPAKVNLGLAILGKRPDGYHDIDTIMAMVDLCDVITISANSEPWITISGMDHIPLESNLMTHAARSWSEATGIAPAWHIEIEKRIPSPAGIGGGSSDAAAVLKALNAAYQQPLTDNQLHELAATLGADCPFFLYGPTARASGIGTTLRQLTPATGWIVLAIPRITGAAKTARLYGLLTAADYGHSSQIDKIESSGIQSEVCPNSFYRAALAEFPALTDLRSTLEDVTNQANLSGAGPAMFATTQSESSARSWADQLRDRTDSNIEIIPAPYLSASPNPQLLS